MGGARWAALLAGFAGVAVVAAALPTGANAYLLAQRYRIEADRSGATVLVTTALSVLTLSALLAWFRAG